MNTYSCNFEARLNGSIGVTNTPYSETVQADNRGEAELMLYDTYEHISCLSIVEVN